MKYRIKGLGIACLGLLMPGLKALGQTAADSASCARALQTLCTLCSTVDFADPKTQSLGTFYKAAPYIVYRGADEQRNWKSAADYTNADEKKGVDEICLRINREINRDTAYRILSYDAHAEREGLWHVLEVSYLRKGIPKKAAFAFLNIEGRFLLGDID